MSINKNEKKKILVLASTFPRWKNDTTPPFVLELEKRLTDDFDIFVLAPHFKGAKKFEILNRLKVNRFQYFWPESWQQLCYQGGILPNLKKNKLLIVEAFTLVIFELVAAIKLIKKERIQLIHAHWIIPQGIIALILNKFFNIPYIITTHGGDIYGLQNKYLQKLKKQILINAKSITVVSNAIRKEIHKKINPNLDIKVISMGVDSKLFNPDKYDENLKKKYDIKGPFLLFVGRLAEKKGVKYLLNAMPKVIKKFPTTKLLIVGDGTLRKELEERSTRLKITKNVIFIGPITNSELPKYYATSDIFIGPSIKEKSGDTEGFGLTFVEALMSGCIPIGTKVGGISDIIDEEKTGFLIDQKNSDAIAITIEKGIKKRKRLINDAVKISRGKFDWQIISSKYRIQYS